MQITVIQTKTSNGHLFYYNAVDNTFVLWERAETENGEYEAAHININHIKSVAKKEFKKSMKLEKVRLTFPD